MVVSPTSAEKEFVGNADVKQMRYLM